MRCKLAADRTKTTPIASAQASTTPHVITILSKQKGISSRQFVFVVIALVALMAFCALLAFELNHSRNTELAYARRNVANLAVTLEGQTRGTIEKIDTALLEVQHYIHSRYPQGLPAGEADNVNSELARQLQHIPESQSLRIMNAQGRPAFDASGKLSAVSISDRAYFLRNKSDPEAGLVISEPIFARITDNWVFTVSRRLTDRQGHFIGLVQAAVNADSLRKLYQTLDVGKRGTVALYDRELRLIARHPNLPDRLGKPIHNPTLEKNLETQTAGVFMAASYQDDERRIFAFRQLNKLPFVVIVGLSEAEVLEEWYRKATIYGLSAVVLGLALLGLILIWQRSYVQAVHLADRMSSAYRESSSRMRALLDSIPDLAWIKDKQQRFNAVNEAYLHLSGKAEADILGKTTFEIWPEPLAKIFHGYDLEVLRSGEPVHFEMTVADPQGKSHVLDYINAPVRDEDGDIVGLAGMARDITARKRAEEKIRHLAEYDALTDLPNRSLLNIRFSEAIALAGGEPLQMALLFVDLDHFKNINDSLGHELGDKLLQQVAERLSTLLDHRDTISRTGGDEFAILLTHFGDAAMIGRISQSLLEGIAQPFTIEGHELTLSASIGISVYPDNGSDLGALMQNADAALFTAKAAGRNNFQFFTSEMNTRVFERLAMENMLRKALGRQELMVYYQPQYRIGEVHPFGFEALLRWRQPEVGMIPPSSFIPIAEETSLIVPIGEWVLREACKQQITWQAQGLPPTSVAVNLSPVQFRQHGLVDMIASALQESGLPAHQLELEITESLLMKNTEQAIQRLNDLKDLGVLLSLDDFGTGYSSLSYLKRFPIDKIKIDQSFVRDMTKDTGDEAIIQAIIAIASKLGMGVIAEGVETREQLDYLHAHECFEVQGFLFSRAVAADEVAAFFDAAAELQT
jgi:diguanylate cyclase (GGDEF)-like protein/PAS domain S-box-containing protein